MVHMFAFLMFLIVGALAALVVVGMIRANRMAIISALRGQGAFSDTPYPLAPQPFAKTLPRSPRRGMAPRQIRWSGVNRAAA